MRIKTLVSKKSHVMNMGEIRGLAGHFAARVIKRIWMFLHAADQTGRPFTGRRWWLRFSWWRPDKERSPPGLFFLNLPPPSLQPEEDAEEGGGEAKVVGHMEN